MMLKPISVSFFILSLIFLISCSDNQGQDSKIKSTEQNIPCASEVNHFALNNGGKSLRKTEFFDEADSVIKVISDKYTSTYTRDSKGRIQTAKFSISDKLVSTTRHEYEDGKLIKTSIHTSDQSGAKSIETKSFIYNKKGLRIGSLKRDSQGKVEESISFKYEYDSNDNWIERKELEEVEGLMETKSIISRSLNEQGGLLSQNTKSQHGESQQTYHYNLEGQLLGYTEINSFNRIEIKLDQNKNKTEEKVFSPDAANNYLEDFTTTRTFDKEGHILTLKMVGIEGETRQEESWEYKACK